MGGGGVGIPPLSRSLQVELGVPELPEVSDVSEVSMGSVGSGLEVSEVSGVSFGSWSDITGTHEHACFFLTPTEQ